MAMVAGSVDKPWTTSDYGRALISTEKLDTGSVVAALVLFTGSASLVSLVGAGELAN